LCGIIHKEWSSKLWLQLKTMARSARRAWPPPTSSDDFNNRSNLERRDRARGGESSAATTPPAGLMIHRRVLGLALAVLPAGCGVGSNRAASESDGGQSVHDSGEGGEASGPLGSAATPSDDGCSLNCGSYSEGAWCSEDAGVGSDGGTCPSPPPTGWWTSDGGFAVGCTVDENDQPACVNG
jgi:hypothetical protein